MKSKSANKKEIGVKSIDNAYETYSLTFDQRWNKSSGIGLYVTADAAGNGALKTTKLGGIYS